MRPNALCALATAVAHRGEIGEVHLDRQRAAAQALDLADQRFAVGGLAHADDHVGAGAGAAERAGAPDAARGAGDQDDLAIELQISVSCLATICNLSSLETI